MRNEVFASAYLLTTAKPIVMSDGLSLGRSFVYCVYVAVALCTPRVSTA
jgi:hypothetical protein